jgi:hypothetical protein
MPPAKRAVPGNPGAIDPAQALTGPGRGSGNHRNGTSVKTVLTEIGPVPLDVPRDRKGESGPLIVPKHARRAGGSARPSSVCMPGA